tara:strand:+ start:934 stop:1371 length:438 start_codon:yes stop_codon:yes gene_type:complete
MIEKAIYNILSNASSLSGVNVSYGISNINETQTSTFTDYIVFYRNSTDPNSTKPFAGNSTGRSQLDTAQIQVNVFSSTALGSANLAEKVKGSLDRKASGTYGGIKVQEINFTNMVSMFEFNESYSAKGIYQISLYYDCRFEPVYQ